ncbi:MAG: sulfatase, partial [Planctomycetota bacterium]
MRPDHPFRPLALACSVCLPLLAPAAAAPQSPGSERPNVLLIIADDQAWSDFGFEGHATIQTPHLDRLAAQGAHFSRGYVPSSLCRPSLATLATGLYPHQHGITGNDPPRGVDRGRMLAHMRALDPLPARLARAGYRCLQTGKWWEGHFSEGGFTDGMTTGDAARGGRHGDRGLQIGRKGLGRVTDFMDECQDSNTPFFVWYAPFLPHQPHDPPLRILERYRTPGKPEAIARYQAMCEWFDETCGTLLEHLRERGLEEDTLVLFLSDNGWITDPETGGFAPRSKRSPYEGGVRTPIVLRWPGRVAAGSRPELVSSIDVVPTILTAAGLEVTHELPGTDLVAVAGGRDPDRAGVFGATYAHDVVDIHVPARGLQFRWTVQGRFKLVRSVDRGLPSELYDLSRDPGEEHDVALQNLAVVAELRESLDRWWPARVPTRPNLLLVV